MSEVTRILLAIDQGNPHIAKELLPLVYEELRKLAAVWLANEKPGQTLDATALVHEAYLRLIGDQHFKNRGHFFAAAAEAMRRILVEQARRKRRKKHGGGLRRVELDEALTTKSPAEELLRLDDALKRFSAIDPLAAKLVELRYFAGLTMVDAAASLAISVRTAERNWTYAKTWLHRDLSETPNQGEHFDED